MSKIARWVREWALVVSMLVGVGAYAAWSALPVVTPAARAVATAVVGVVQPLFIFSMLYLTFCNVDLSALRPRRWHLPLLLIQTGAFAAIGMVLMAMPESGLRVVLEGAMICFICPTATAAAVVTRRLGGDMAGITAYTMLVNLAAALLIPIMVPFVHPSPGMHVLHAMAMILGKVFPLLLLPLLAAMATRLWLPGLQRRLAERPNLSFQIWTVALALALAMTARGLAHSQVSAQARLGLVAVSLAACIVQFRAGRRIGARHGDKVTAGQALGQKNTVFAIWLGYTFFSPVTAIAGGFYCIWHNLANSLQLHRSQARAEARS